MGIIMSDKNKKQFISNYMEKSWHDVEEEVMRKKVILYGLGKSISDFFQRYGNQIALESIIDNNISKQGVEAGVLLEEVSDTLSEKIIVSGNDVLSDYNPDDVVVLVASARKYVEITCELEEKGFNNYFVIPLLKDYSENVVKTVEEKTKEYVKKFSALPICENKIFFVTYGNYTDHEKYISNALLKLSSDLDIVWLVSDLKAELPTGTRKVYRRNLKKMIYEAETAAIWISDNSMPNFLNKRPEQIYIQTKHWASITLKKFYLDAATFDSEPAKLALWKRESEIIDYIVVGSEFDKESCKRGFQFDKEFIMAGSPRSDGLFHEQENKEKVYAYYDLEENTQVLMYAPTYRFSREKGKSVHQSREIEFDYRAVKNALEKRFGGKWKIALRLHPSVAAAVKEMMLPDFVLDVSSYEDSEELVSAFDITISDFSSLMFEPAFVKKPVFLYATDLEDYLKNEYELLINYKKLPFDIAENTEQLCNHILNFDRDRYEKRLDEFLEQYGVYEDGHASERVADFIVNLIMNH